MKESSTCLGVMTYNLLYLEGIIQAFHKNILYRLKSLICLPLLPYLTSKVIDDSELQPYKLPWTKEAGFFSKRPLKPVNTVQLSKTISLSIPLS